MTQLAEQDELPMPTALVEDPADWRGPDMEASQQWIHSLDEADVAEVDAAMREVQRRGLELVEIGRGGFPLPRLGPRLTALRHEVLDGRGFVLIRGLPAMRYTLREAATIYWGIGRHLGDPVPQNGRGHMLGHVRDLGYSTDDPKRRGYQTTERLEYHTDSCDVVGLLCVRTAKSGGYSTLVSAVAIHNEIMRTRPDLLRVLYQPYWVDRRAEIPAGAQPYYRMPVFHYHAERLIVNYERLHIESSQRFSELPPFTPAQWEALRLVDRLANDPSFHMRMSFQPGDIQLLHNHAIMHSRTSYEDHAEPERKRHLLRLWLSVAEDRPLPHWYPERYGEGRRSGIYVPDFPPVATLEPQ